MDSIPVHTSLVPNEKIWGNCHHRIHKRTSQHRSCVLRLYLTFLTKKRNGTSSEIQHPTCQTTRDQKAIKVIITTKRAVRLQWFQSGNSNNRRNYQYIKKLGPARHLEHPTLLKTSSTQTYLMWIQSHVVSTGNEPVDKLAKNADRMLFQNRIKNPLTDNIEKNGQKQLLIIRKNVAIRVWISKPG